ncbi:hypothetical protein TrVE_jg8963 [Triparma verrucosa]|uniref:Uncharacterized protein n=1 Tax=Triparma verrucosa TaxID=1606542 RepID=A0A9W6ZB14_9STRA|nr:hypothetical protein TrVE_jg8963 [Triparma verrucosa]
MKVSAIVLTTVASVLATASANSGTCTYIDSFGSDLCEHGNTDSWLPDWAEEAADQAACLGLSNAGCSWDTATGKCFQNPSNCVGASEEACNGLAAKGCYWKEAGACDPHDAMSCTATGTAFYTCTHTAWSDLISDVLSKVDPFDPTTWNISSLIDDFVNRMKNGCASKFLECFFLTECGNPQLVVTNICEDTLDEICVELGISAADCPKDWCAMGVTQGSSLIDIALDFADDFDIDQFFDAAKVEELRKTIDYIVGGKFDLDWIDFDKSTGKIKITIPPNSIISQAEIDDIIAKLQNMLSGSSSSLMTSDKGFAVQSVAVSSKIATIDSSEAAWEGAKVEEGMSKIQMISIAGACVGLVAAVVGGVMYKRSRSGGATKPKQYGMTASKKSGNKKSGNKFMKGGVDIDSYV